MPAVTEYTFAIAHQLTAQLMRMAALPPDLLCGHAAQFEFWADEVAHCLKLIDSYESRFHLMLRLQQQRASVVDPIFFRPVPRPGYVPEPHRYHVRSELCRALAHFARVCAGHTELSPAEIGQRCAELGITIDL